MSGQHQPPPPQQHLIFRKRMCFQCHQPFQCTKGFCYGDYCVKSLVADKYVSKGCENRSSSSRSGTMSHDRNDVDEVPPSLAAGTEPSGCYQVDVFGVPNTVCYCSDMDFCNAASIQRLTKSFLPFFVSLFIIIPCTFQYFYI
ncbi:hypothetical protein DdX_09948 [Ditylenchus destructor]|uniref:Uncharacterized protein n=1 Tax=Ditylenchus destructor TaxID=166010 RepID=A0AAD4N307_9BILA|nr:hypothetical protein DdX_09948 [Ditylenchus destructor]